MPANQAQLEGAQVVNVGEIEVPVYIQVIGPGQVRFGMDPQQLQQNPNEGIPFTAATNNLPQCMLRWKGPLYFIGNVSNQNGGVPFSINWPELRMQGQRR